MNPATYSKSNTSTRTVEKKLSNAQALEKVGNASVTNGQKSSGIQQSPQLQKSEAKTQDNDNKQMILQLFEQLFQEKIQNEQNRIKELENQQGKIITENQQLYKKLEQQEDRIQKLEQKIQQQEVKIQPQGDNLQLKQKLEQQEQKIQLLEQKIESQNQNQGNNDIQEKIQNFISKNDQAHEIWRMSSEKIQNAYGTIEQQFQDLEIYKQQIAQKVNQDIININSSIKDELTNFQEKMLSTQQQVHMNLSNLQKYEETLFKYCQEINKFLNPQGFQMQNYNDNQFQQYDQYAQPLDQQYNQQQFEQPYQQYSQPSYINPPQQQQPIQNDINSASQYVPNYQDSQIHTQGKSKIRLISQIQAPQQPQ